MTRREYLNSILALCTEGEQKRFTQMYPDGPSDKQLKWAISQIENTIHVRSHVRALYRSNELKTKNDELEGQVKSLQREMAKLAEQVVNKDRTIKRLQSNPANTDSADVQERLELLAALEAAGVDNWEWYDDAVGSMGP